MEKITITIAEEETGLRIDRFIAENLNISRNAAQQLIEEGNVWVDKKPVVKSFRLMAKTKLEIEIPPPEDTRIYPEDIPLEIVYEDKHLLVVNKPKGMVVHSAAGLYSGTLVNGLLFHCAKHLSSIGGEVRPGIVHRIDKDTSGLLVVAKEDKTHEALARQFAEHTITRVYQAVVYGGFAKDIGVVDAAIGRSLSDRKKMAVVKSGGKRAVTNYRVLARYSKFTHLELRLETGRTHQIRVHMASIGHPVAGDPVYGPRQLIHSLQGQCLHAGILGFIHPVTQEYIEFSSSLPSVFWQFLEKLEKEASL